MDININNYEVFFLDYLDGNLDESVVPEFEAFLKSNNLIDNELLSEHFVTLKEEHFDYPNKPAIKKFKFDQTPILKSTFDDFCIAYFENQLSQLKEKEFFDFIKSNPEYEADLSLYSKVYITPQPNLYFKHKSALYKQKAAIGKNFILRGIVSFAASIVLIFGIYLKFKEQVPGKPYKSLSQNLVANSTTLSDKRLIKVKSFSTIHNIKKQSVNRLIHLNSNVKSIEQIKPYSNVERKDTIQIALISPKVGHLNETEIELNPPIITQKFLPFQVNNVEKSSNITDYALLQIKNNLGLDKMQDSKGRFSFFKILQAGVKGFNQLTESSIELTGMTDESGKLTAMSIKTESGIFQIHHKRSKKE